jgi:hypothetical protein
MKIPSVFCISAIAASSLITLSTAALAISEPRNISANLDSQAALISEYSTQNIALEAKEEKSEGSEENGRICIPILDPLCGWW